MAVQYANARLVTDGLVLALDAADRNSYVSGSSTWTDLSGNNNNGAIFGTLGYDSSNNGGSIIFNGSTNYVSINSNASILSNTAYTKMSWFYTTSFATFNNIVSGGVSGQHAFWLAGGNKLNAGHNSSWYTVTSTTTLLLNTWYLGAVSFNTTSGWKLYLNGILESTNASTTTFTGAGEILLGAFSAGGSLFSGKIPKAQVYNRVLSETEVLQNYNAQKTRFGLT